MRIRVFLYRNKFGATMTGGIFLGIHVGLIIRFYLLYVRIIMSMIDIILIQVLLLLLLLIDDNWSSGYHKIRICFYI